MEPLPRLVASGATLQAAQERAKSGTASESFIRPGLRGPPRAASSRAAAEASIAHEAQRAGADRRLGAAHPGALGEHPDGRAAPLGGRAPDHGVSEDLLERSAEHPGGDLEPTGVDD